MKRKTTLLLLLCLCCALLLSGCYVNSDPWPASSGGSAPLETEAQPAQEGGNEVVTITIPPVDENAAPGFNG